ncbi:MAG TPA: Zn-ribbon domain-containing OB-fold protein [Acidimicrobiales bacterium]|nr:Zn-ribbon domain-containing OB-fold protein [Acidimicrobiales bacterium]
MTDLVLPEGVREALADVEPVRGIRTPARLDYTFTAGTATSRFLRGIRNKQILGQRCPVCHKVYVPPRGSCPTDGVPTTEQVELPHTGVVTTFCVVNVQFYGQVMEVPYVCATVLLDGADLGLFGLVQEIPFDKVRMGLRVEAVWVDDDELTTDLASIRYWRPTGEPDAAYETYREHV